VEVQYVRGDGVPAVDLWEDEDDFEEDEA
jgi:hypothetical protein